jgi:hypothetical protein
MAAHFTLLLVMPVLTTMSALTQTPYFYGSSSRGMWVKSTFRSEIAVLHENPLHH